MQDLMIIGGGINGVGVACDAAGRGLSVTLCEQDDLASGTSSWSSKLIHGGLRYLEYYEFKLVRKALQEREVLLQKAPHLIHPLTFIMPHDKTLRPVWMIRAGLFLYDHLSKRTTLASSRKLKLKCHAAGKPLKNSIKIGFSYADARVDDSRLVMLNAMSAREHGAHILTRHTCTKAKRLDNHWQITLTQPDGLQRTVKARALVNAAGPWVDQVTQDAIGLKTSHHLQLVKGSHILVNKLYQEDHAYILQNDDKRIIFVIPYLDRFSLIGTTDIPFSGDLKKPEITAEEVDYLCRAVNRYFSSAIHPEDVIASYAGVRPLHGDERGDPSAITRDYVLDLNNRSGKPPLITVFGGKITTYRKLAEQAMVMLQPYFPDLGSPWTASARLPGGDISAPTFKAFLSNLVQRYPWLDNALARRYANSYGSLCQHWLKSAQSINDLGQHFGAGLYASEVDYLVAREWAQTADDIIWRRSKLGYQLTPTQIKALADYLK